MFGVSFSINSYNNQNNQSRYCTVKECKYPSTHNILSHQCGDCGNYGHSCSEPDDNINYNDNNKVTKIPMSHQCTIKGCMHKETHTIKGHKCKACERFGHSFHECNVNVDPRNIFNLYENIKLSYVTIYSGMGSYVYYKNNNKSFTMSHGDWGQYGHSKKPELLKFLKGCDPLRDCDYVMLV